MDPETGQIDGFGDIFIPRSRYGHWETGRFYDQGEDGVAEQIRLGATLQHVLLNFPLIFFGFLRTLANTW